MSYFTEIPYLLPAEERLSKVLAWAGTFDSYCLLNTNSFGNAWSSGTLLACGVQDELATKDLADLDRFHQKYEASLFGMFNYELKNELEALGSRHERAFDFPLIYFFLPRFLLHLQEGKIMLETPGPVDLQHPCTELAALITLLSGSLPAIVSKSMTAMPPKGPTLKTRETRASYLEKAGMIKEHIKAGNIYELNFCQEFYLENTELNAEQVYLNLNKASPAPFSMLFKYLDSYIISSSMERFLKKEGNTLISEPIKGTIRRGSNPGEDKSLALELEHNEKERAENIMIVDLVRNDLSRIALPGTVQVTRLASVFPFAQVYQMISTIQAEIKPFTSLEEIIGASFPMGSMTGAPKISAMELIDTYESSSRCMYAGSAGFIDVKGNFDFNVLIRTIFMDARTGYLSFHTGSALTDLSDPEAEYEECLLKAKGILLALEIKIKG